MRLNPLGTKPFLVCFLYFYIWAYKLHVMEMEHYVVSMDLEDTKLT